MQIARCSLLLSWTSACVHACVRGCRLGCLYTHLHFILSFCICHKSTCRILYFRAPASTCASEFACSSVIVVSRQGHSERLRRMKDVNNASKYWWLPLETCTPYAKWMHMINCSSPLSFVLPNFVSLISFRRQTVQAEEEMPLFSLAFLFCHSLSSSSSLQREDSAAAAAILNECIFG